MNIKQIIPTVAILLVSVVFIASMLIPIVQVAQSDQRTSANNTTEIMAAVIGEDLNLEIVNDNGDITLNDVPVVSGTNVVFYSDDLIVQIVGTTLRVFEFKESGVNNVVTTEVSIVNGAYSFTAGNVEYTGEITGTGLYVSDKGEYGAFSSVTGLNVDSNATIYVASLNRSYTNGNDTISGVSIVSSGNVADGFVSDFAGSYSGGVWTEINVSVSSTFTEQDGNYYTFSNPSYSFTVSDVAYSGGINTMIFAPIEYTYVSENDSIIVAMLGIIPVLALVIPIMIVTRALGMGRD